MIKKLALVLLLSAPLTEADTYLLMRSTGTGNVTDRKPIAAGQYLFATGTGVLDGVSPLLTHLSPFTSAQLAGVLTDESGTGVLLTVNGDGSGLTALNGASIASGNIAAARINNALRAPGPIGIDAQGSGAFTTGSFSGVVTHAEDILASTNSSWDIGKTGARFRDGWFGGILTVGNSINSGNDITAQGNLTAASATFSGAVTHGEDVLASINASWDLGKTATRFRDGWFAGTLTAGGTLATSGNLTVGGTATVVGAVTAVDNAYAPGWNGSAKLTTENAVHDRLAAVNPPGEIIMFAGALPAGFLNCDGATVSQATYAALFAAISHTFGTDPGGGNFILPDLRDRFPVGIGSTYSLAVTGGEAAHELTGAEAPVLATSSTGSDVPGTTTYATGAYGANGNPHNTLPPYIGVRFVIRTGL